MLQAAQPPPAVALGVLSEFRRRAQRDAFRASSHRGPFLVLKFLITAGRTNATETEQAQHGDLLTLNKMARESRFLCAYKYLLWFEHCNTHFHDAFWAVADVDTYVSIPHLVADLQSVEHSSAAILYGLIMWHCYVDEHELVTHWCWGKWSESDRTAVKMRQRIESCAADLRNGKHAASATSCRLCPKGKPFCTDGVQKPDINAIKSGGLGSFPPFPFANGPLFAVSPTLGRLLLNSKLPRQYLRRLAALPRVRSVMDAERHNAKPVVLGGVGTGCYPAADSVLGYWISAVAIATRTAVTLVNTPFMKQHHPWPSPQSLSNASIVLHGLKGPRQEHYRQEAMQRSSGPFEPTQRVCGDCHRMGWCRWKSGPCMALNWRCCGAPRRGYLGG